MSTVLSQPPDPWISVEWPTSMPRALEDLAADSGWEVREHNGEKPPAGRAPRPLGRASGIRIVDGARGLLDVA